MNREQADRFIYGALTALQRAGVDNRIKPLLDLAPADFVEFRDSVLADPSLAWTDAEAMPSGEIYYCGAIVRAKP